MDRRTFIGSVAGGLLAAPFAVYAQKLASPVIGLLIPAGLNADSSAMLAFGRGLSESGYVEGKNVRIEIRRADGRYDQLPALAADLVNRHVAVVVTTGGGISARAAKAATSTIPILFIGVANPVAGGFVESLARPGGNITGVTILDIELIAKRVELLHEMVPKATVIALLVNPDNTRGAEASASNALAATHSLGLQLHVLQARTEQDIHAAFATLAQLHVGGLIVMADIFLSSRGDLIPGLAARYAMPTLFESRASGVTAGGLMSYGPDYPDAYRQLGMYAGKMLNGAKPAELPVLQPTKFELVINTRTAKALGLTIPQSLLVRAELIDG
jgi:putative tryptophan/tyrosine transport system substrate-binding protein